LTLPAPTPQSWRSTLLAWAFTIVFVGIALDIAVKLLRSIEPELIVIGVVAAVVYVLYFIHRFRQSRW
jgi:hypothetical protein